MYNKLPELLQLVDHLTNEHAPDVFLLCETWLTKHTPSFSIPGYSICRSDRDSRKGGGVSVVTSNRL